MKLPRFIKLPEHNKFNYTPVYYDPKKEALEAKINKYKAEKEAEEKGEYKPDFKGKFVSPTRRSMTRKHNRSSNLRLLVIILFLGVLAFYVMQKADLISEMFNVLFSG